MHAVLHDVLQRVVMAVHVRIHAIPQEKGPDRLLQLLNVAVLRDALDGVVAEHEEEVGVRRGRLQGLLHSGDVGFHVGLVVDLLGLVGLVNGDSRRVDHHEGDTSAIRELDHVVVEPVRHVPLIISGRRGACHLRARGRIALVVIVVAEHGQPRNARQLRRSAVLCIVEVDVPPRIVPRRIAGARHAVLVEVVTQGQHQIRRIRGGPQLHLVCDSLLPRRVIVAVPRRAPVPEREKGESRAIQHEVGILRRTRRQQGQQHNSGSPHGSND
mmetsp:Transcript_14852/g.56265  ORF Transcript_14852/g.56265 Transcript_14852/m.56265 type:complete len:270 (-) Transcript_14852:105-914(-)